MVEHPFQLILVGNPEHKHLKQERIWVSKFLVYVGKRIHNRHINAQITTMVADSNNIESDCTRCLK
jgi:hypothetical protein